MSLRSDVLHSIKWLAAGRLVGQLIAWSVTIFVIRILQPSDYGLMAVAEMMIGFAVLFRSLGLFTALVQKRDLTARHMEQAFGILFLVNSIIYIAFYTSAPWIAAFFDEPRLTNMIRVLSIKFPLAAVGMIQSAMLSRRMDFKSKSFVRLSATISNSLTTLILALSGAGVWALVYGSLVSSVVNSAGMVLAARYWCRPRFSLTGMGSLLRFGSFMTTSKIIGYVSSRADVFIIGKILGKDMLGFYEIARELASLPHRKTAQILSQVGLVAYASEQQDLAAIRFHFLKVTRTLGFIAFPVFWGISSVSPEFVHVVLGERWDSAIIPLQILSIVMPMRMLAGTVSSPLEAIGKPHLLTIMQSASLVIMPLSFLIGAWYGGLIGATLAWATGYPVVVLIRLFISLRALGLIYADYFHSLAGPGLGGLVMYAAVILMRNLVAEPFLPPIAGLAVLVVTGVATYALSMWFLRRRDCREFLDLAKMY
jgi:O-antigen/teichoic acid export membrane protein